MVFAVRCTPRVDPYLVQQFMVALDSALIRVSNSAHMLERGELEAHVPDVGHGSSWRSCPSAGRPGAAAALRVRRRHGARGFGHGHCVLKCGELLQMVMNVEGDRAEAACRERLNAQRAEHDMFCLDLRARFDVQKAELARVNDDLRKEIARLNLELEDAARTAAEAHAKIVEANEKAEDYRRKWVEAQDDKFNKERAALERENYATRLLAQRREIDELERVAKGHAEEKQLLENEIQHLNERIRLIKLKKNTSFVAMCASDVFCGQFDDDGDLLDKHGLAPEEYDPKLRGVKNGDGYEQSELNGVSEFVNRAIDGGFQEELMPKAMRKPKEASMTDPRPRRRAAGLGP
ncbi:hypothetical protein JL721_7672 [Aureococcus anophagefferens]|nr:hypothetical protein JL721_7672 [Aureococcus anophagefferens]